MHGPHALSLLYQRPMIAVIELLPTAVALAALPTLRKAPLVTVPVTLETKLTLLAVAVITPLLDWRLLNAAVALPEFSTANWMLLVAWLP